MAAGPDGSIILTMATSSLVAATILLHFGMLMGAKNETSKVPVIFPCAPYSAMMISVSLRQILADMSVFGTYPMESGWDKSMQIPLQPDTLHSDEGSMACVLVASPALG